MIKAKKICGVFTPYPTWCAESGMKNKGIYGENAVASLLGDSTYKGWSTSRFNERGARDVKAFGRKVEVKCNRGAFQLYREGNESKSSYLDRYFSTASASMYAFGIMHGAKNLNGHFTVYVLNKLQARDYVENSEHWSFEQRPGGEVLRWKSGFVDDISTLDKYLA